MSGTKKAGGMLEEGVQEALQEIYPDDFKKDEANNFPVWVEGVDTTFAPFLPTPMNLVLESLQLAGATERDSLLDLGCGDGRFCVTAVTAFGAREAWGVEVDADALERAQTSLSALSKLLPTETPERVHFDDINFDDDDFLKQVVEDQKWTILVTVLTGDFQQARQGFVRDFLNRYPERRCVSVFFNMNGIEDIQCVKRTEKCYVYAGTCFPGKENQSS